MNHSLNTQLALLYDYVDIALTYDRVSEKLSVDEGWSVNAGCVFHDHFVLAGPLNDPAKIFGSEMGLSSALATIAKNGYESESGIAPKVLFLARNDGSATMIKERTLWSAIGNRPWEDKRRGNWYQMRRSSPAEAIIEADKAGAYLLTDRSTFLSQVLLGNINFTTILFEPRSGQDVLMNSCFALQSSDGTRSNREASNKFVEYLLSCRGQAAVATFGEKEVGFPLFAPVIDGFATSSLVGGRPRNRRWEVDVIQE